VIALVLLALGLGVALTAYEFSPHTRANVDDYARAIREAHAAHRAADARLYAAGTAPLDQAIDHAIAAKDANQVAAKSTGDMAKNAKTPDERTATAQSAGKVLDRDKQIQAALSALGVGQCDVKTYKRVTEQVKDLLLTKLHGLGMAVTGTNPWGPWDIAAHHTPDVNLRAVWNPLAQELKLIVTTGKIPFLISCDDIWEKIDPAVKGVIGT